MAQQDTEIVRRYFELVDRMLRRVLGRRPSPSGTSRALHRAFEQVRLDAEWTPPYLENPLRGREDWLQSIEDWLDAAEHWRINLDDVSDLGDGIVLVASRNQIRGQGSGVDVEQRIFTIVTLVDGKIATIKDFPDRAEALAAAGISAA